MATGTKGQPSPAPPVADIEAVLRTVHGQTLTDPYAWLRPGNWAEALRDPTKLPTRIRSYLDRENDYTDSILAPLEPLRRELRSNMMSAALPHRGNPSLLLPKDGWYYYQRSIGGGAALHLRSRSKPDLTRQEMADDEQLLLDPASTFSGHSHIRVLTAEPSPDHRRFAFAVDLVGAEAYDLYLFDPDANNPPRKIAEGTDGSLVWAGPDTLYFLRRDALQRPRWLYRLRVDHGREELVHENADPRLIMGLERSRSGRFVIIGFWNEETTEQLLIDTRDPRQTVRETLGRTPQRHYFLDENGKDLFIRDSAGTTPEFRILKAPIDDLSSPVELVAERAGVNLWDMCAFEHYLAWQEIQDAKISIRAMHLTSGAVVEVPFEEESFSCQILPQQDPAGSVLRLNYVSPTTPGQVIDFDMASGTIARRDGGPSLDRGEYSLRLVTVTTRDQRQLPLTLFHRKDLALDGSAPALLTGYGGHGMPSHFVFGMQPLWQCLAERGWIVGLAHVRGSSDKGRQWSLDGKKLNKVHGFEDLIDATEHVIRHGYTARKSVSIFGASAGGYLVGGTTNLRPDLYRAVIAAVPFVDVLNTELDESLPPTPRSWAEWGDPLHNIEDFENLLRISPYDNVRPQPYPHMLITGGLADLRVPFWEPAKLAVRLRACSQGETKILLRMRGAGHGAASSSGMLDELAEYAAFLIRAHSPQGLG